MYVRVFIVRSFNFKCTWNNYRASNNGFYIQDIILYEFWKGKERRVSEKKKKKEKARASGEIRGKINGMLTVTRRPREQARDHLKD